jgi:glycosyltransferase involved in cell wall biosynthesis
VPGWDFDVWFMGKNVKNRIWKEDEMNKYDFKYHFLSGFTLNIGKADNYPFWVNIFSPFLLFGARPDVVIMNGWDSLTSFLVHLTCRILNIKFLIYSDSTENERSWRRFVTLPLVKLHVKSSDGYLAGGTRAKRYLEILGANPDKIAITYNTIDLGNYVKLINSYRASSGEIRRELGIQNKKVIMFYGQLIKRKGVDLLIKVYKKLQSTRDDAFLLIVGDGQYKNYLQLLAKKIGITNFAILPNPGDVEICKYYAIADVFVLPSREEVWGVVINEAMSAGLPVIVSNIAGSSEDLVKDGVNGFQFENENESSLLEKLNLILSDDGKLKEMGRKSFAMIQSYSPEITSKNIIDLVNSYAK